MQLPYELALKALQVAQEKAHDLDEPSSIAIVDAGGHLLAFSRHDRAIFGTAEIAINKAYTSASLGTTSADVYEWCKPGGESPGLLNSTNRPFVGFGGGFPLILEGKVIGAVGVSGGPVTADESIGSVMAKFIISELEAQS